MSTMIAWIAGVVLLFLQAPLFQASGMYHEEWTRDKKGDARASSAVLAIVATIFLVLGVALLVSK